MRYAFIRPDGTLDRLRTDIDPSVPCKAGYRWIPCPPVAPPAFDPMTEIVIGPSYIVNALDVTEQWTKRALTTQEIGDKKDADITNIMKAGYAPIFKAFFNINNRVLTLEGKPTLTPAQFQAQIKALM